MCSIHPALLEMELFAFHSNFQEINTRFSVCGDKDVASLLHHEQPESKDSGEATRKGRISGACKVQGCLKKFKVNFCLCKQSIFKILLEETSTWLRA